MAPNNLVHFSEEDPLNDLENESQIPKVKTEPEEVSVFYLFTNYRPQFPICAFLRLKCALCSVPYSLYPGEHVCRFS